MVDDAQVMGVTEDQLKGSVNETKGKIKQIAGKLVGSESL